MVGLRGLGAGGAEVGQAIAMFVGSSILVSTYIYGISRWGLSPWNALAIINVPNLMIYLPIWYLFLPSGIDQATVSEIATQVAFQGLGPGFFALIFFTLAATHLGASATSSFSAAVPAGVAVLAIPVLGEAPTAMEWAGIALVVHLTPLSQVPPVGQMLFQVVVSAPILLIAAPFFGPLIRDVTPLTYAGMAFQIFAIASFGFMFWFWLIGIYRASSVASFAFLSPVLAVFFGWAILNETLSWGIGAALAMVVSGLMLINRR